MGSIWTAWSLHHSHYDMNEDDCCTKKQPTWLHRLGEHSVLRSSQRIRSGSWRRSHRCHRSWRSGSGWWWRRPIRASSLTEIARRRDRQDGKSWLLKGPFERHCHHAQAGGSLILHLSSSCRQLEPNGLGLKDVMPWGNGWRAMETVTRRAICTKFTLSFLSFLSLALM